MAVKTTEIINFQVKRDFGELIGSPFHFLKQEFKPFMGTLLRYAGPFLGIGLLAMMMFSNDLYSSSMAFGGGLMPSSMGSMFVFMFFFMLSFFMASLTANSYITAYVNSGKGNFDHKDVWNIAKKNIGRYIGAGFLVGLMVGVGFILIYIPGIILGVFLSFVFIIIVFEELPAGQAISRSFAVVKGNWWFVFGLMLVFGMIMGFTSYMFMLPGYIIGMFGAATGDFDGLSMIIVVVSMVAYFTVYLIMGALQQVLVAFTFFSITGKSEGINLEDKINAIYKTENASDNTGTATSTGTKTKVEDYYPELSNDTPSWSDEPEKKETKEEKQKEENRFTKKDDDHNRFKPKDKEDKSNRFKSPDDDFDRFKPKY